MMGRFQVNITLAEHRGTKRRVEILEIEFLPGTSGTLIWAQKEQAFSSAQTKRNTRSTFYRYLDGSEPQRNSLIPLHPLKLPSILLSMMIFGPSQSREENWRN